MGLFSLSNLTAPGAGPYVIVNETTNCSAIVTWSTIPHSFNGVIQKYSAAVYINNKKIAEVFVNVTEERIAQFGGLFAGKQYEVKVCGYTNHPSCGRHTTSTFKTLPICKLRKTSDLK